ncbi:hypothetical protein [Escherichia coli]|uniref:hypothetical protein n=1 Tax=Escherichia coli TaxID=562 RepID=UPI000DE82169|nr:hypothetical protein [Escherichia coli]RBQ41314.1 hypothetical protein C2129_23545 [Escherichia coli]
MPTALIMATENTYLKCGVRYLTQQEADYKYYDFDNISSLEAISQLHRNVYIIVDSNCSLCSAVFSSNSVKCIYTEDITLHDDKIFLPNDGLQPPVQLFNSFNEVEKKILYLYFIKQEKVKNISVITNLTEGKVYYRIRMIKIKFGVKTTRKLPILFKGYF